MQNRIRKNLPFLNRVIWCSRFKNNIEAVCLTRMFLRKMGKHINIQQEEEMINFMEKHPQLGKGFAKGDRVEIEKLWKDLTEILNSVGGPIKSSDGWKKIWGDKKSSIKKKLATNRRESRATGGGPYNQLYVSSREEAIAKLCGLYDVVDGIDKSVCFGHQPTVTEIDETDPVSYIMDEDIRSADEQEHPSTSTVTQNKKRKIESTSLQDNLKKFMATESNTNAEIVKSLTEMLNISKKFESGLRRVYKSMDKLTTLVGEQNKAISKVSEEISNQNKENERHHRKMEKLLYEKNILKEKTLEIQKQQLEIYKL